MRELVAENAEDQSGDRGEEGGKRRCIREGKKGIEPIPGIGRLKRFRGKRKDEKVFQRFSVQGLTLSAIAESLQKGEPTRKEDSTHLNFGPRESSGC